MSVTLAIPSLNASRFSDTPLASTFTSRCRPPAAHFLFSSEKAKSAAHAICARELLIWTFWQIWEDEKNSKLRVINDGRGTDSVPGQHVFNSLQAFKNRVSFRFIPKLLVRGMRLRDELWVLARSLGHPHHSFGKKVFRGPFP